MGDMLLEINFHRYGQRGRFIGSRPRDAEIVPSNPYKSRPSIASTARNGRKINLTSSGLWRYMGR